MTAALALDEVERLQARLNAMEQERKHLLAVIEILQEIGGTLQFGDIVQSVARRLGETFGLDRCSIFLRDKSGQLMVPVSSQLADRGAVAVVTGGHVCRADGDVVMLRPRSADVIAVALDILHKRPIPPAVFVKHQLVTPENVDHIYPNDTLMQIASC